MGAEAIVVLGLAYAFAFTTGFQDASNSIATLIATRAARPGGALALAATFMLVGPLVVGAAIAHAGLDAVNWIEVDGWRVLGVAGVLVALAVSPVLGAAAALLTLRLLRRALRRATRRIEAPVRVA